LPIFGLGSLVHDHKVEQPYLRGHAFGYTPLGHYPTRYGLVGTSHRITGRTPMTGRAYPCTSPYGLNCIQKLLQSLANAVGRVLMDLQPCLLSNQVLVGSAQRAFNVVALVL